jgi:hypothetical protein
LSLIDPTKFELEEFVEPDYSKESPCEFLERMCNAEIYDNGYTVYSECLWSLMTAAFNYFDKKVTYDRTVDTSS